MIKGLRTAVYPVPDLAAAASWYTSVFGVEPYFNQPFYVGYAVAGFELGLIPDGTPGVQGSRAYWGVDDIDAEVARLLTLGAGLHAAVQDVGDGIKTAELSDPYGNLLGLIENPHFNAAKVA